MANWEYKRVVLSWGHNRFHRKTDAEIADVVQETLNEEDEDWYANIGEDEELYVIGFTEILDYCGKLGWEAVNVFPSIFLNYAGSIGLKPMLKAEQYTVIFKRQIS